MGTRANIIIRENSDEKILYSHFDGYIVNGVGEMLEEFIWNFMGSGIKLTRPLIEEFQIRLTNKMHPNAEVFTLQDTDCIHGDIEYLYIIEVKNNLPNLVAYARKSDEAWDNGPQDYLNSWTIVELINALDYVTEG
jgi:hypothetical protein